MSVVLNICIEDGTLTHKEYSKGKKVEDVIRDFGCEDRSSLFLEAEPLSQDMLVEDIPMGKVLYLMESCEAGSVLCNE